MRHFAKYIRRLSSVILLLSGMASAAMSASLPVEAPENSHSIGVVTDICGYKYNIIKIGTQLWMGENMRCWKYDTGSEQAGHTIPESITASYDPYYNNCSTNGISVTYTSGSNLTNKQKSYIGNFYNWAAALGLTAAQSRAQTTDFASPRQGICPNGWHIPSDAEWMDLVQYIEVTDGKGENTAAKHLKTTTGWSSNNGNGVDTYGFSMLPADRGIGKYIYGIGGFAKFTTSTAKSETFADYMNVMGDALKIVGSVGYTSAKSHTYTVRCVRSAETYNIKFLNYDRSELQSSDVLMGDIPEYTGATPTKPVDAHYIYTFTGWNPTIEPVTRNMSYMAQYTAELRVLDAPENSHSTGTVTDICGNKYNVVRIGDQLWLSENMRCNKYDTECEHAGAEIPLGDRSTVGINPYFQVYPSAGSNQTDHAQSLSDSQISYLGLFYSWSAAVGFATGEEAVAQTTAFDIDRQGICPNGWHIPTPEEWRELVDYIEVTDGNGIGTAGKHLKSASGWFDDGNGLDTYGFSALPADRAGIFATYGVGGWAKYWSATATSANQVSTCQLKYSSNAFLYNSDEANRKYYDALCVRCVRRVDKFEIRFLNEDGTLLQSGDVASGDIPEYTGLTPTKDATAQYTYTFSGWSPDVVAVTEAADYTAQYTSTINKYEIKFVNYNGEELQSSEIEYGTVPTYTGEAPTKPATAAETYTFIGWDIEPTAVTEAKTYTAQFSSTTNQYTVRFLNYNGEVLQTESLDYGTTPTYKGETPTQPATAQYTYTFSGWDKKIVSVTEATDYTATYTSTTNKYLIKFVNYDGTELQSGEVEYGTVPTYSGETPVKPATAQDTYTFTGWDAVPTAVTEAKTYTAQFSSTTNQYTVRFLNYDGDVLQIESLDYGTTPTYTGETPTRDATAQYTYTFSGWSPEVVAVTEAADYTAQYTSTINKYEIKFVNYDGTELQSSELEYGTVPTYTGETPTKPATAAETYTFSGWDIEPTAVTEAKTYTAQFSSTTNQYTVRFLNYNGDVLQTESLAYGTTPSYTGSTPTKDATAQYTYTFSGWSPDVVAVTEAADYTAQYTSTTNKYEIKFVNYNGEELQSGEVEYGTVPTYTGEAPTKPATAAETYTFSGWDSEPAAVTEAKTYTAQFSSITNQYTVTVNAESHGTVTGGGTYPYGTEVTLTAKPEDGYDIDHWSNGSASAEIKITVTEDVTLTAYFKMTKKPNPDNTPACNNIPSVAKYEWLLMVNVKALNEQGYTFGESDVTWYKVVGEMDNLDKPEERTDEAVGTGYYYTIDETLNGTGSYYALVDLPLKTSDVACPGTLRTQLYSYEAPTLKSAMVMEPTIVAPMQPIEVKNLPESADTEIFVFDTVGKLYRSFKTQGNATATFNAEMRPGVYVVLVRTGKNKTSLKYIVRRSVAQ